LAADSAALTMLGIFNFPHPLFNDQIFGKYDANFRIFSGSFAQCSGMSIEVFPARRGGVSGGVADSW
jgi:hypothetical protein